MNQNKNQNQARAKERMIKMLRKSIAKKKETLTNLQSSLMSDEIQLKKLTMEKL